MAQNNHSADHSTFASIWEEYTGSTGLHAVNKIQPGEKQSYCRPWVQILSNICK